MSKRTRQYIGTSGSSLLAVQEVVNTKKGNIEDE